MENLRLSDESKFFGPPEGWNEEKHGPCLTLSVADLEIEGHGFMVTMWKFSAEEIEKIVAGEPFFIGISGHTSNGFPLLRLGV